MSNRVLATLRLPGPAFAELGGPAIVALAELEPSGGVEALIVANEDVGDAVLDLLPDLRVVANFGVGYDRIDVEACRGRGVVVTNTPGVLDAATADLALALLLAVQRRVVEGDRRIRAGGWRAGWSQGTLALELAGSTLGIVGLGRIGTAVARRAAGFGLRLLYTKQVPLEPAAERALGVEWRALDDLLAESDSVTVHAPRTPGTVGLLDARRLSLLHDGAVLVNTARAELVDRDALVRELVSGRLSAGLDVFWDEPNVPEELVGLDNVVLTPHIGSATEVARFGMTRVVVDNVLAVLAGRAPLTPVG
ncbi:MAG TPA: NAD(P)-dependent oxidoreductase [Gaiellaceae bacterium]|nr:NAD(P)-dependent oxidoreductase [Gaiellaceae bacterium]